ELVEVSFFRLIDALSSLSLLFGVVSPSQSILSQSERLGASFVYLDPGENLNESLSQAVQNLPMKHPILIIMPDLPFITKEFIETITTEIQTEDLLLVPSISEDDSKGTAILYMKQPQLLSFQFGKKSSLKYQAAAKKAALRIRVLEYDPYARDMDTINDVYYLQQNLHLINDPGRYIDLLSYLSMTI
ncbi:MAG: NTP transferase domain-containing protein, partial [Candidatus Thorarchaeota archaeon]